MSSSKKNYLERDFAAGFIRVYRTGDTVSLVDIYDPAL